MARSMQVYWIDRGREPRCPPNPLYPDGIDVDCSEGAIATCTVNLPYPARRCGEYRINCETCGQVIMVTTAGRRDDPRTVKIACELVKKGH